MTETQKKPRPKRTRRDAYRVMRAMPALAQGTGALSDSPFRAFNITVPTPLADVLDKAVLRGGTSRSDIVTKALVEFFQVESIGGDSVQAA